MEIGRSAVGTWACVWASPSGAVWRRRMHCSRARRRHDNVPYISTSSSSSSSGDGYGRPSCLDAGWLAGGLDGGVGERLSARQAAWRRCQLSVRCCGQPDDDDRRPALTDRELASTGAMNDYRNHDHCAIVLPTDCRRPPRRAAVTAAASLTAALCDPRRDNNSTTSHSSPAISAAVKQSVSRRLNWSCIDTAVYHWRDAANISNLHC